MVKFVGVYLFRVDNMGLVMDDYYCLVINWINGDNNFF